MANDHVDLSVLSTLRDVMEGEYPTLLDVFIKDSVKRVIELNGVLQDPAFSTASTVDLQQLGAMAHSFKGSSGNMGATHLSELCRQLEELGRGPAIADDGQVGRLVLEIESEFRVVRDIFEHELHVSLTGH